MRSGQGGATRDGDERATVPWKRTHSSRSRIRVLPGAPAAWHARRESEEGSQRGSVTAEVAVVLPALVVLLALLLTTAQVGAVQLRLEEAARAGAREAVRGESRASVQQTAQRLAGDSATARVTSAGTWTTIDVRARVEGPLVGLMDLELHASASGRKEHDG
ncbi:TadE family type IV pilus minor pilin [Arthrobacter sp. TMS1-12-1]